MATVRGCLFPESLYYNVEHNVWSRPREDGLVQVGMTSYACSLSGTIIAVTPRRVGKDVKKEKSLATVESGKWVGPVKAPAAGEVVAINEQLLNYPGLINEDPYGEGWLVLLRCEDWSADSHDLLTGEAALVAYADKMEQDGFGGC